MGLSVFLWTGNALIAQAAHQKTIAILMFANSNGSRNHEYLRNSIPEAVSTSIGQLKRFEIVDDKTVQKAMTRAKVLQLTKLSENQGQKIARQLKADFFIMGSYLAMGGQIQIYDKIFDTKSGEIKGSATQRGKLDNTIFDSLDSFAIQIAQNFDKAVPLKRVTEYVYTDKMRIALVDMEMRKGDISIALAATDLLRAELISVDKFIMVERSQINKVIQEQGFQQKGLTDDTTLVQIGKMTQKY